MARLLLMVLLLMPPVARAADPEPKLTPAQATDLADTLQNDAKRAQLIAILRGLAATQVASAKPAAPPGSVGVRLLGRATGWIDTLGDRLGASIADLREVPALIRWLGRLGTDPEQRDLVLRGAGVAGLIALAAVLVGAVVARLLRPIRWRIDHRGEAVHTPPRHGRSWRMATRLPGAVGRIVIGLIPISAFAVTGTLLSGSSLIELQATRVITLDLIETGVLFRLALAAVDLLASPGSAHWRLLDIGDASGRYAMRWTRRLVGVALFGGLIATVAGVLGLTQSACQTIIKLVALVVHAGVVVVIWQCRHAVMAVIDRHGSIVPLPDGPEPRRAAIWAWVMSSIVMLLWLVWAAQPAGGFSRRVRFIVVTVAVLLIARLVSTVVLGGLDRAFHAGSLSPGERRHLWHRRLRGGSAVVILVLTIGAMMQAWGVDIAAVYRAGGVGPQLLSTFGTLAVITAVAFALWELVVVTLERQTRALTEAGRTAQAQRLRTLTPLLRTCLMIAIVTVVGLTALSEVGVDVAPLLAGAGIFGVALGFGSQKLVQDFITGIFLLLENAMQVGEWVTVAGLSGTVEQLSVRTIQLRGGDGSLYVIPFSSVTTVNNINRGIGNAAISVTVAASADTDAVGAAIKQIGAEMRDDPAFSGSIRSDLELWGVDRIDATTATLTGQIECTDAGRWGVQREFNRRAKKRFDELAIPLANPATIVVMQDAAPLATIGPHRESDPGESAATVAVSPPPHAG